MSGQDSERAFEEGQDLPTWREVFSALVPRRWRKRTA
jgi:hypothetical protein